MTRRSSRRDTKSYGEFPGHQRAVGDTLRVISENPDPETDRYWGISDNYLRVLLPSGVGGDREIHSVLATAAEDDHLLSAHKIEPVARAV